MKRRVISVILTLVLLLLTISTTTFAKSERNPFDVLTDQVKMILNSIGFIKTDVDGLKAENQTLKMNMEDLSKEVELLKNEVEKLKNEATDNPDETESPKVTALDNKDNFYNIVDSSGNRVYTDNGIIALQDNVFNREIDSLSIISNVERLTGGTLAFVSAQKKDSQWEISLVVQNASNGVPEQLETVLKDFDLQMKSLYSNMSEDVVKTEIYYDGTFMGKSVSNRFKFSKETITDIRNGMVTFTNSYTGWSMQEGNISSLVLGKSYYLGTYSISGVWEAVAIDDDGKAYFFFWM